MAANLYQEVLTRLGMGIVNGDISPGRRLVLSDLERAYGVSRTVARDAIKVVESLGLVTSRRRAGIEVQPAGNWRVLDPQIIAWRLAGEGREGQIAALTQLREAVEPRAARLAAVAASREEAQRLVDLAARMTEVGLHGDGRSQAFVDADLQFHCCLLVASHNDLFAAMQGLVREVLWGRNAHKLTPPRPDPRALLQHELLAAAVQAGRPDAAEAASRSLLLIVEAELGEFVAADALGAG